MRWFPLLLGAVALAAVAVPADAQIYVEVVHQCGALTLSSHGTNAGGANAPASMDTTGDLCVGATFTGSISSRDSVLAKAIVVHACAARVLSSTGNPETPLSQDTTGDLCTNATGGGGGSANTADTIYTFKGCTISPNSCDPHIFADTIGHVRDSVNASVNVKNLPALPAGTNKIGAFGDSLYSWFGSTAPTVGSKTSANSLPVVIASDQGAVAVSGARQDSLPGAAKIVHACGALANASSGNPYTPFYEDSTGDLCTNATSGGGGNPTGGYLNGIGKDTIAAPLLNGKVAVADSITSVPLTTGGYIGLDSIIAGHCLASPNGCDLHAYVDTLGHVRDSLNASVNVKNLPSVTVGSPLLNAKVSGADSVWNSLTVGAMPAVDSTQLRTGTHHAARVAIDSLVGGTLISRANPSYTSSSGYEPISADTNGRERVRLDSMSGCPTENYPSNCPLHVVADSSHVGYPPGDSLQRSDSLIIADTVYQRAADTCVTAFGGKSVADSASFPAVSGKYIYLTGLSLAVCDTLAVTGTTYLTITTSNLRGLTFETGNAQAVGTCTPIQTPQISNGSPVRSTASNTLTQVKIPAAGTGAYGYISMCGYYHAMRMLLDPNEYAMRVEPAREPRPKPPTFDVWRDAA